MATDRRRYMHEQRRRHTWRGMAMEMMRPPLDCERRSVTLWRVWNQR